MKGLNSRLDDAKERICHIKNRAVELNFQRSRKRKEL